MGGGSKFDANPYKNWLTTRRKSTGIHADAQGPLEAWHSETLKAAWTTPQQVKKQFGSASILKAGRVVFNIAGNKYRLVAALDFGRQACFVKFIGTHSQYDAINAETVNENSTNKN